MAGPGPGSSLAGWMGWDCSFALVWAPRMLTASLLRVPPGAPAGPRFPPAVTLRPAPHLRSLAPGPAPPACWWASVRMHFIPVAPNMSWGRGNRPGGSSQGPGFLRGTAESGLGRTSRAALCRRGCLTSGLLGTAHAWSCKDHGASGEVGMLGNSNRTPGGHRGAGADLGGLQGSGRWCGWPWGLSGTQRSRPGGLDWR